MEAKKFTNNCYMITDSYGTKLGFAMIRGSTVLFTHDLEFYDSIESIASKFEEKLLYTELPSSDVVVKEIGGYPIKHDMFYEEDEAEFNDDTVWTYKPREGGNVIYVAGWWVIVNESTVYANLSPKITTLSDTSVGPFKNKFDCQAEVNRVVNERKSI